MQCRPMVRSCSPVPSPLLALYQNAREQVSEKGDCDMHLRTPVFSSVSWLCSRFTTVPYSSGGLWPPKGRAMRRAKLPLWGSLVLFPWALVLSGRPGGTRCWQCLFSLGSGVRWRSGWGPERPGLQEAEVVLSQTPGLSCEGSEAGSLSEAPLTSSL